MTAEQLDLTGMVEDVQIPCEAREHAGEEQDAEWVVWIVQCCPARPRFGLSCDGCLQRWLTDRSIRTCDCGRSSTPALWITHFERINKSPVAER